jgi:hypothetical protein
MILYEVTLQINPGLASKVEDYMRRTHIPQIFATGCFRQIRFDRASAGRFRACYQASNQDDLDRYLKEHAPVMRAEFSALFPTGVMITRETWSPQESWGK